MQLNVPADLETLINKRLSSGAYISVEDVLRRALEFYDACAFLAEAPMRGHSRPDLTTRSLRFWTLTRYPSYTVVYRPETVPLQVVFWLAFRFLVLLSVSVPLW